MGYVLINKVGKNGCNGLHVDDAWLRHFYAPLLHCYCTSYHDVMRKFAMMEIRQANDHEFGRLAEIFNSARSSTECFSGKPVDSDGLKQLTEGEAVYVAERRRQIVGFASVWVPDNFIHHLYVPPDLHGQGIGSELLKYCSDKHGPLSLKCEVLNFGARKFYRDRGWIARERGEGIDGAWERLYSPTHMTK